MGFKLTLVSAITASDARTGTVVSYAYQCYWKDQLCKSIDCPYSGAVNSILVSQARDSIPVNAVHLVSLSRSSRVDSYQLSAHLEDGQLLRGGVQGRSARVNAHMKSGFCSVVNYFRIREIVFAQSLTQLNTCMRKSPCIMLNAACHPGRAPVSLMPL